MRSRTGARRRVAVWNSLMRDGVAQGRDDVRTHELRLIYHGSIVPSRLPVTVIEALASLPESVSLQIAGYETTGHPAYVETLLSRARVLGAGDRVKYVGIVPRRKDLMRHCAAGDVGL